MYTPPTESQIRQGATQIRDSFGSPFFIGRNGTIEIEVLFFWLTNRRGGAQRSYPTRLLEQIQRNAGIFPGTPESIDEWCEAYTDVLTGMTGGAAGWFAPTFNAEKAILDTYAPNAFRTPLRSLEPYYMPAGLRWTEKLVGKRVAVVSSFADTMQAQINRADKIWTGAEEGLLPQDVKWNFIRTGYAPTVSQGNASWPSSVNTWQEAVNHVVTSVILSQSEIALVGCGGLGMIIAGRLKEAGISTIVLGGAIQVLFGIKGRRWASHDIISRFWNDSWVSPSATEIPGAAGSIEGGCYW
jgi:hypothetical protein